MFTVVSWQEDSGAAVNNGCSQSQKHSLKIIYVEAGPTGVLTGVKMGGGVVSCHECLTAQSRLLSVSG